MQLGRWVKTIQGRGGFVKVFLERRAELDALGFRWNSLA